MSEEADRLIARLGMQPHPEGGHFIETFRDVPGPDGRARSTAIYFLLKRGEHSHWHRVDAVEIWHFHAGAPLKLGIAPPSGALEWHILGTQIAAGQRPQAIVPQGHWQSAQSTGDYTLVGCTVAPGFEFSGFDLAPPGWEPV
jgi:predicted cupin superfamily sugar epimerase